jgi:hypothetical protein
MGAVVNDAAHNLAQLIKSGSAKFESADDSGWLARAFTF